MTFYSSSCDLTYRDQPPDRFSSEEEEEEAKDTSSTSSDEGTQTFLGILSSPSTDYLVQSYLGEGTFGKVAKCLKTSTNETVAVKIIKHKCFTPEAQNEVNILQQLRAFDGDRYNFVKFNDTFVESGNICMEFEMLDVSLWDYLEKKPAYTLTVKEIRPILYQMAVTLQLLKTQGLIHSDLKPDNIMLVDHHHQPMKIKMIDFGLARDVSQVECGTYMQPRYYRAPEVILGSPFTTAMDMWSLGCIAAELYLGYALYPGSSEYDMLRRMVQTQGHFPQKALNHGVRTEYFFKKWRKGRRWRLKSPSEFGYNNFPETEFKSLDDLKKVRPVHHLSDEDARAEEEDRDNFVELLKQMLHLDVDKRITPSLLLQDPFITMRDLTDSFPYSFYVKSSCEMMEVCQDQQTSTSSISFSSQATPAWRNYKEHPAIMSITSEISSSFSCSDSSTQQKLTSPETPMIVDGDPCCSDGDGKRQRDKNPEQERKKMKLDEQTEEGMDSAQPSTSSSDAKTDDPIVQTRQQKRKRDIQDVDGSESLDNKPEQRRKRSQEKDKTTSDVPKNREDASIKTQRKRKRVTSEDEEHKLKEPDMSSPERKKMRFMFELKISSTEAQIKPQRKRKRDTFVAAHSELSESDDGSPVRKRRRLEVKLQRKRTWDEFKASHTELKELQSDSPEKKRRRMNPEEEKKTSKEIWSNTNTEHAMTRRTRKHQKKMGKNQVTGIRNRIRHTRRQRGKKGRIIVFTEIREI